MANDESYLMIGGPVDGERWVTEGQKYVYVPEREELPWRIPYIPSLDALSKPAFKTHQYQLRSLRSPTREWIVYQHTGMDMDIIEALIRGYKGIGGKVDGGE